MKEKQGGTVMNRLKNFYLDRNNGKVFGVCAGLARMLGWDATFIRVGLVVATLAGGWPWTAIAYVAAAVIAKARSRSFSETDELRNWRGSTHDLKRQSRDIDHRMAEIDSYVASSNRRLAEEFEQLR
jgi:phage shock protein C